MEADTVVSIVCPDCGTEMEPDQNVCDRCGANTVGDVDPVNIQHSRLMDRPWLLVIVLLHVGLLGIPLYWRTKYSTPVRVAMIVVSIVYTLFVVILTFQVLAFVINTFRHLR